MSASETHGFNVGDHVGIVEVGCDCDEYHEDDGWCYRHTLVGLQATITEVVLDGTLVMYRLDLDDFDYWFNNELVAGVTPNLIAK